LEIAQKAGICEALIFKRFTTKQVLFLAAMGLTETPKWAQTLSSDTPTTAIKSELTDICGKMLTFYQEVLLRMLMIDDDSRQSALFIAESSAGKNC
jgi:hypothetical protein